MFIEATYLNGDQDTFSDMDELVRHVEANPHLLVDTVAGVYDLTENFHTAIGPKWLDSTVKYNLTQAHLVPELSQYHTGLVVAVADLLYNGNWGTAANINPTIAKEVLTWASRKAGRRMFLACRNFLKTVAP